MQELFNMIIPQRRFIYKAIVMTFFVAVTYLFFRENGKKAKDKLAALLKQPWPLAFILCTAYLFSCSLMGRYVTSPYNHIFGSFGIIDSEGNLNADMMANILMYLPFTFLYIMAFRPRQPWKASLLLSVGATLFFELSQLIGWLGSFQIADIVHNVIGGMLGCGLWYLLKRAREHHWVSRSFIAIRDAVLSFREKNN